MVASSFVPCARADWTIATDARLRHDNNVGNAESSEYGVGDSIVAARLTAFQVIAVADGMTLLVNGDLNGESFSSLKGLNNASLGAGLGIKKKWGLGAFVPWARAGVSVGRSNYNDDYRNAWIYRATLSAGQRIDARWNVWADYWFERRAAINSLEQETRGLSSNAFSQNSHNVTFNTEFSVSDRVFLGLGVLARRGDVVSTTEPGAKIYAAARAQAEDATFGPDAYAYRLMGTTYGVRVGLSYSPTTHSLLGCGFQRTETRAHGGNSYTKSIPEISWDYRF